MSSSLVSYLSDSTIKTRHGNCRGLAGLSKAIVFIAVDDEHRCIRELPILNPGCIEVVPHRPPT